MNFETSISRQEDSIEMLSDEEMAARTRKRWIIAGVILAALAVAIAVYMLSGNKTAGADDTKKDTQAPHVSVVVPGRQMVANTVSATGTIGARREMPVGAVGEGGLVSRVYVEPGDWVREGQVLASIERSVQSQETNQLAASVNVAQADARLAQSELDRAQTLVARGFVSKADIDRKTATRDSALARVRVAQAQLGANRARVGRLDIRAPAGGLVLTRAVEPGQVVGGGGAVLFRLARGGEMELKAQLSEGDLAKMSKGISATVTPVGSTTAFTGQVWQLSPVIDPQSRQGTVRIAMPYNTALRPGGFASAAIISGTVEVPMLPESAVLSDPNGNFVFVVGKDNKVERRAVTVGSVTDKGVSIAEGLAGTEQVVLSAGGFLNAGETVKPDRVKPAR
ncbi:MAG: efflux RND transporter periplasmic adaptor subunit [Chakrabartia sp.]